VVRVRRRVAIAVRTSRRVNRLLDRLLPHGWEHIPIPGGLGVAGWSAGAVLLIDWTGHILIGKGTKLFGVVHDAVWLPILMENYRSQTVIVKTDLAALCLVNCPLSITHAGCHAAWVESGVAAAFTVDIVQANFTLAKRGAAEYWVGCWYRGGKCQYDPLRSQHVGWYEASIIIRGKYWNSCLDGQEVRE